MSTFTDIRDGFVKVGLPLLGAALPIPGGMALCSALAAAVGAPDASPASILDHLGQSADALEKAREFALTHQETILKITVQAEVDAAAAVNKTMQTEAASDHWPTYSWRPFIGFMFGGYVASMWLLPLAHLQPVILSSDLTLAVGSILGIASFYRGKMQADTNVKTDNKG